MARQIGSATWQGGLMNGAGEVTVGDGVWTGGYSTGARFHGVLPGVPDGTGTSPEQLLAAAHAACFTMALSLALTEAGAEPRRLQTRATVHLRFLDGAPTIQQIDLETEGDVPGVDELGFRERAEAAKRTCIISRALGGVDQIGLVTRLADAGARDSTMVGADA